MSKKIVLSVLLSLLFGILGAKASVGGFPVYRGFPYKGEAMDNGMWQWETTADDRIVCKINGTRLKRGWLCVFGDSERLCVELGGAMVFPVRSSRMSNFQVLLVSKLVNWQK